MDARVSAEISLLKPSGGLNDVPHLPPTAMATFELLRHRNGIILGGRVFAGVIKDLEMKSPKVLTTEAKIRMVLPQASEVEIGSSR